MRPRFLEEFARIFRSIPLPYSIITLPPTSDPPSSPYLAHLHNGIVDCLVTVLQRFGFLFVKSPHYANIVIGTRLPAEEYQLIKSWVRVSHFLNAALIGSKAELHRRMRELRTRLGHEIGYYPVAFYPPDEYEELCEVWNEVPIWIVKAPALSRGRAIRLTRPEDEPPPMLPFVVEKYIPRPLLITGRKFDIRLYALVTSAFPLVIYLHENGLALFATQPYDETEIGDLTRHITNHQINRHSGSFVACDGLEEKVENSKWSLSFLWQYLESQGIDWRRIKKEAEDVATSAIIAGMCAVRNAHCTQCQHRRCAFELLGVDLLIDQDLKVWLLEINVTPGMFPSSELDSFLKSKVALDLFNVIRMVDCGRGNSAPCRRFTRLEWILRHSFSPERRQAVIRGEVRPWDDPGLVDHMIVRELVDEQTRRGGFRLVYPRRKTLDGYAKYFDMMTYEDIVLAEWTKMKHRARVKALLKNIERHRVEMNRAVSKRTDTTKQTDCNVG
jgi:tubulin polyglutamylase TTLL4